MLYNSLPLQLRRHDVSLPCLHHRNGGDSNGRSNDWCRLVHHRSLSSSSLSVKGVRHLLGGGAGSPRNFVLRVGGSGSDGVDSTILCINNGLSGTSNTLLHDLSGGLLRRVLGRVQAGAEVVAFLPVTAELDEKEVKLVEYGRGEEGERDDIEVTLTAEAGGEEFGEGGNVG